jgi:IS66 C-terminal element
VITFGWISRSPSPDCAEGAANWACIASLVETCKLNGIDPEAYIADVLTKLVNLWPDARIDELLPWATNPTAQAA